MVPREIEHRQHYGRRSFWRPTSFELLIAIVVVVAWFFGIVVLIRHEQAGLLLSAAYILLGLIGVAVSWLLMWPLMRILLHRRDMRE